MSVDREIQDNLTDRAAARAMQRAAGRPYYDGEDIDLLDAAWMSTARDLAAMDDDGFNRALDAIESQREATAPDVMARIDELTVNLIDWRHISWETAEIAAGRDPHRSD